MGPSSKVRYRKTGDESRDFCLLAWSKSNLHPEDSGQSHCSLSELQNSPAGQKSGMAVPWAHR